MNIPALSMALLAGVSLAASSRPDLPSDTIPTTAGDLRITFIGHGSLMFEFGGLVLHVDPYGKLADYSVLPKADAVLVTHEHGDHLDPAAIRAVRKPGTVIVHSASCAGRLDGLVMTNGQTRAVLGIPVEAVPAYNRVNKRPDGQPFHPRGTGNGYVLTFGDKRVYVAADTENIPEMKALRDIAVAFLPMNLPYTMTPEMVAEAARAFRPAILYPYHTGDTDTSRLVKQLEPEADIEVRIRPMR